MINRKPGRRMGKILRNYLSIMFFFVAVTMIVNITVMLFIRSHMSAELLDSQSMYINAQASVMDEAFCNLEQTFNTLQGNPQIQKHTMNNYRQRTDYLTNEDAIFSLLNSLCFTSSAIDDLFISWNNADYLSTAQGLINKQTYFEHRFEGDYTEWKNKLAGQYTRMTLCKIDAVSKTETIMSGVGLMGTSGIYLLQSILNVNTNNGGVLCVALKQTFLDSIFYDAAFSSGHTIALFDSERNVITANRGDSEIRDLIARIDYADAHPDRSLQAIGLLSQKKSQVLDVNCVIYTPYQQVLGTFDRVFVIAGVLYGAVLLLMMGYAYLMSHRMYRPFREIMSTLGEKIPGEHTRDETSYINDRIVNLLSVNHSMQNSLENGSRLILQSVLYKTIMGSPSVEEYVKTADSYNLPFQQGNYEVAVVWLNLPTNQDEQFYAQYHDEFTLFIRESLEPWIVDTLDTRVDEYTLVFCLRSAQEQERLNRALADVYEWLDQRFTNSSIFIGVSEAMGSIHLLKKCYNQALAALRYRSVQNQTPILYYRPDAYQPTAPYLPDNLEENLRDYIENAKSDALIRYIEEVLDINYNNNVSYETFLSVCVVINRFLIRMVRGQDVIAQTDLIHINTVDDQYTSKRCREIILSNVKMAMTVFSRQDKASNAVIDQVIQHVEDHFMEPINLDTVAQSLGYTPNYLSRYFKQKRGINFTDYLNSRRVVCARELLADTPLTLQEIALKCGFGSANVLIRAYEKYEGTTPGQFRKSIKEKISIKE